MGMTYRTITPLVWLLLAATLFGACTTTQSRDIPPEKRRDYAVRDIRDLISESEYSRAIQRIETERRGELLAPETTAELYENAVSGMQGRFRTLVEEQKYREALSVYRSLEVIDELDPLSEWSQQRLRVSLAEHYRDEGNTVLALNALTEIEELSSVETETLQSFVSSAVRHRHQFALRQIEEVLAQRGVALGADAEEVLSKTPDPSTMQQGTVTVWVNRGIRIEQGQGVPDRVIGSGFFIDKRGYIVTNYHVVQSEVDPEYEGYSRLYVRLPGQEDQRIPAKVVGYDRIFDIALLKVEVEPSYVFSFTNTKVLSPGTDILTIGSPGGLQSSISSGIISATDRRFLQLGEVLQVDLPINPGNSGGPVFDKSGKLVGVVFAGIEQFEGVNFAIPSYWVRPILDKLYDGGEVPHSWLGAAVNETDEGLEVMYVAPDSPAREAGLSQGDLIRRIAGKKVSRIEDAQDLLLDRAPGELLPVTWHQGAESEGNGDTSDSQDGSDDGRTVTRVLSLGDRPYSPVEQALEVQDIADVLPVLYGMNIDEVSRFPWQRQYVIQNVYSGSIADETGLSENDPFSLLDWRVNYDRRFVSIQLVIRKRKAGFIETGIQLTAPLEPNNFL
jgi:S1-C subfamily serine protease